MIKSLGGEVKKLFIILSLLLSGLLATVTDGDGNVYETVQIGHQVWMQENLKATHYRNGDAIPTGLDDNSWANTIDGAYVIYDDNPENAEIYGNLYNWFTVDDDRGICPADYHVPSDDEFTNLTDFLGGVSIAGGKMKESGTEHWNSPNEGATNESGFTGLPAGYRDIPNGGYNSMGNYAPFWSSTEWAAENYAFGRALNSSSSVTETAGNGIYGWSIRCLSDETQTTTILVPENFATIQEAIDYSMDGDTILVSAGTYYENINFNGKNIALIGEDRETTIIDGGQNGRVISNVNILESHLANFTIQNGNGGDGGGIFVQNSNISIINCLVKDNISSDDGGGICLTGTGNAYISNLLLINNVAHSAGGGIVFGNDTTYIINSTFNGNISNNYSNSDFWVSSSITTMKNSILWDDNIWFYPEPYIGTLDIIFSNIQGGWEGTGNIDAEPLFTDPDNGDYTLQSTSPCIDAGDPESDLDPDGTRADMGAYPFFQIPGCIDSLATNFDTEANINNGSCEYPDNGDYSLSFDGVDDYGDIPQNNISIANNSSSTISFWFKLPNPVVHPSDMILLSNHWQSISADNIVVIGLWGNATPEDKGKIYGHIKDNDNGIYTHITSSMRVDDGDWHYYSIVLDKAQSIAKQYIDGILDQTYNLPPNYNFDKANGWKCSGDYGYSNYFVQNFTDEINFWSIALDSTQIQSYISTPPTGNEEGLVGYWNFNSGSGDILYDHSGNGNHGTINGATWVENIEGCTDPCMESYNSEANFDDGSCETFVGCPNNGDYSLSFDGVDDYVNIESNFEDFGSGMTIDFMIKPDFNRGGFQRFFQTQSALSPVVNYILIGSTEIPTDLYFAIGLGAVHHQIVINNVIENNKWQQFSITMDALGSTLLYKDGVSIGEEEFELPYNELRTISWLGKSDNDGDDYFSGYLNNFSFWNRNLTIEEINNIQFNEVENNLLAYYKFNAGSGDILYDHSGNGNHGTINGATWVENIEGCTDSYADNYNPDANWDDGSCEYPDNGDYSLSFDGVDDYVLVDKEVLSGAFTISAWILPNINVDYHKAVYACFNSSQPSETLEIWLGYGHDGTLRLHVGGNHWIDSPIDVIEFGEWNHIIGLWDGNEARIYSNGNLVASGDSELLENPNLHTFNIGARMNNSTNKFLGKIDKIDLFNFSLSTEEIENLNNLEFIEINSSASYRFNQGPNGPFNDILIDHSGNGNHGTINGAQWVGCTDISACNFVDSEVEDDGSCWYAQENFDCDGNCIAELDCNGECGGLAVEDCNGLCEGGAIEDCNGACGGSAYLDDCSVCSAGMSGHSPNSDIDCNGDCVEDTPVSCEDTTGNGQCGNAAEDDCNMCSGGNSGHIANSDMDECSVCFSNNFTELCIDADDCSLMDCNGDCGGIDGIPDTGDEALMDDCNVCSEGNTGHPFNSDIDCNGECFGIAIVDSFDTCCLDPAHIDGCGECGGNDYDLCDGDADGDYNIDDWGYGAHGFGDSQGISVEDIPEDQGGRVYITFHKSFYDTDTLRNTESYTIERLDDDIWTSLHSIAAYGSESYQTVAETLNDVINTDTTYTEFRIIASMEEGNFVSLDDENGFGYSVDNIDPSTPDDVMASASENNVDISWDYAQDIDFSYHQVTELDELQFTISNDVSVILLDEYNEYYMNSVDIHDNYSNKSDYVGAHDLHAGANLVSFSVLPEDSSIGNVITDGVNGVIGEGVAASPNPVLGWVGSLTSIDTSKGYWVKADSDFIHLTVGEKLYVENYDLHSGANLISYTCSGDGNLSELIAEDCIVGIIGEGVAANNLPTAGWVGSLGNLEPGKGYWFKTSEACELSYDCPELSGDQLSRYDAEQVKDYIQSTQQAFYFIEHIENIEVGDIVSSYCNDTKVGSRVWIGAYTDIPAMGNDNSDLTKDYCTSSSVPSFRVEKPSGEAYALTGDIPAWESNGLHMLSSLQEAIILPESYSLAAAYPNPFNPTTTINFAIPADTDVSISVYNLQGREVVSLANQSYEAGYHSIIWNADTHSSGVYFVKMVAGSYINTQKLMLVK